MKRKALTLTLIMVTATLSLCTLLMVENVEATDNYSIEKVNHTIEVLYGGHIFVNDTIHINGTAPNGFIIGFPYKYGPYVLQCTAYNETDVFPVSLNVPLENHAGFYSAKVSFPQGTPQIFTVGFILSNNLLVRESQNMSRLDFPAYPSLTKKADLCNALVLLPEASEYVGGTVDALTYSQENLAAFTYRPGNVTFSHPGEGIRIVDVIELKRKIRINGMGGLEGSDTYYITNKDVIQEMSSFEIVLPKNATNPTAHDSLGGKMQKPEKTEETNRYEVLFRLPLATGESTVFTVEYQLLGEVYIKKKEYKSADLVFPLFQHLNYYVSRVSVTFILPEGGKMISFENASVVGAYSLTREVFQEALTINRQGVFSLNSFSLQLTYEYDFLWLSFRPTLWMWTLAIVGCAIAVIWRRPKAAIPVAAPKVRVGVDSEEIKSFVDAYERKKKIIPKLKSLKIRARKGKISRRRYKVQRKTLQTRLKAVSRELTDLMKKMQAAGGRYRDLMHRLEVAETEINEVEVNIRSIEARHRRGELSLGAYNKLLSDYRRRRERAESTINEILIRLREEIH